MNSINKYTTLKKIGDDNDGKESEKIILSDAEFALCEVLTELKVSLDATRLR